MVRRPGQHVQDPQRAGLRRAHRGVEHRRGRRSDRPLPARITGASSVKHRRTVVLLEPDELSALADKMPEQLRLSVLLAGWCGLRRGEVFALTRGDISKDYSAVTIDKAVTYRRREYVCGPPKTAESNRTVTVPPHLRPVIKDHLHRFTGKPRAALLFPDPVSGSFYAEGRFRGPFFSARDAIGKPDLHFHDLRHFGGVMAALTGATTREVMDRLGHTTTTAAMRYQHVAAGRADALAERLSASAEGFDEFQHAGTPQAWRVLLRVA